MNYSEKALFDRQILAFRFVANRSVSLYLRSECKNGGLLSKFLIVIITYIKLYELFLSSLDSLLRVNCIKLAFESLA